MKTLTGVFVFVVAIATVAAAQDGCKTDLRRLLYAHVPARIIVQPLFRFGSPPESKELDLFEHRPWIATPVGPDGAVVIDSDLPTEKLRELFSKSLRYVRIEEDPYIRADCRRRCRVLPNDEVFKKSNKHWWFDRIHAPEAWAHGHGDRSIVAAVIDSGIWSSHTDLQRNVFVTSCDFDVEVDGKKVTCKAGDSGYNSITGDCASTALSDHGTEVAGIIGAVGDNGEGVTGVNWAVTMLPVTLLDKGDGACASRAVKALEFVRKFNDGKRPRVRVVNLSWSMDDKSDTLEQELRRVADENIVIVASAGNRARDIDGAPSFPASYTSIPTLIAISSSTRHRFMLPESNYGRLSVQIAAPGEDIHTTAFQLEPFLDFSQTSAAAPFVTGAIALLASQCPDMSGKELRDLVLDHSDTLLRLRFRRHVSHGRYLNLKKASDACEAWKRRRNAP